MGTLESFAKDLAGSVITDLEQRGHTIGRELQDRATKVAEMAALVYLNGTLGIEQDQELKLLEARMAALQAAGASALAAAITDNLRRLALKGIGVLAGL